MDQMSILSFIKTEQLLTSQRTLGLGQSITLLSGLTTLDFGSRTFTSQAHQICNHLTLPWIAFPGATKESAKKLDSLFLQMKFVLLLSIVAIGSDLVHCGSLTQGSVCQMTSDCLPQFVCNNWKDITKRCQPNICLGEGEKCGWFRGRCCTCENVYCYKSDTDEATKCTPLCEIPASERSQVMLANV